MPFRLEEGGGNMSRLTMKNVFFVLSLTVSLGVPPLGADTTTDDAKTQEALKSNVIDFRDWLIKELSQFPKEPSPGSRHAPRNYVSISRKKSCFTASQYNQAAQSDWVKSQVMAGLSILGQQLANTAGTAFAQNSAGQLNQYATQLNQSDDPQFQQIGTLYTQEAQALQSGNVQAADQAANQVSAVPQPYVAPGYQPTQQESQVASAFNQVIGTIIAGLGGVLGTLAVSQILQALGIPNLASLLGTGQVAGTSLATGQNPSGVASNAGANAIYQGGSSAMQQLGTLNLSPRQSQNSANAGGAPAAQ
jgi:hypothetical protein